MSAKAYNVVWADDECDTLNCNAIEGYFDERDIGVLAFVPNSEDLKRALESYKDTAKHL